MELQQWKQNFIRDYLDEKELSEGKGIKEMENLPLQTGQSSIALW